jgi:hypothetical protein
MTKEKVAAIIGEHIESFGNQPVDYNRNEFHEMWKGHDGSIIQVSYRKLSPDSDFHVVWKRFVPSNLPLWDWISFPYRPGPHPVWRSR